MPEELTSKLLVVRSETGAPEPIQISLVDLREAILNQPDLIVDALRDLLQPAPTTGPTPGAFESFPLDTPISKMVPEDKAGLLSARARRLTKQDLLALGGIGVPQTTPEALSLSVADMQTIQEAFADLLVPQGTAGLAPIEVGDLCCCCCPCCCCTAATVIQPVRSVA